MEGVGRRVFERGSGMAREGREWYDYILTKKHEFLLLVG